MNRRSRGLALTAVAGVTALGLAACSSSSSSGSGPSGGSGPVFGGTLKIVASGGPDHIDTVPAYYTADYILERTYARQLLSYPSQPDPTITSAGWTADVTPVPDVASALPTITNGGKTYTFHLRSGVDWNTTPKRAVTSQDFLREFKAFCNPVSPVGNLLYFSATIAGLNDYCNAETAAFAKVKTPTAAAIAAFQNTHSISGISTPDANTIVFNLIAPASDFEYMMAMPFTSARPVEYDSYLPASLDLNTHSVSDGPYQITSFVPDKSITLDRNPAWSQASDPIRHQYVKTITVTIGVTDAQTQLADQKAGKFDLVLDTGVLPSALPSLATNPDFHIWPGSSTNPYIVFNLRSPNNGGAMSKLLVRQAIEYGVNKVAVQRLLGGPSVSQIINTAIPPGNVGYVNYNDYQTTGNQGNSAKCKADLAAAGYKSGLNLKYLYPNDSINSGIFQSIQASLKLCGINLSGQPESGGTFFVDLGNTPQNAKAGTFDLSTAGWFPDWFGNNGRTVISPLFQTRCVLNTNNYGCYSNPTVDKLINEAEAASTLTAAGNFWHQADEAVMHDAVIVPMIDGQNPIFASSNVRQAGLPSGGVVFTPNIGGPDLTNIWLKNG